MSAVFVSNTSPALVVVMRGEVNVNTLRMRHSIVMPHLRAGMLNAVVFDSREATLYDEAAYEEQQRLNAQLAPCVRRLAIVVSSPRFAFRARLVYADLPSQVFYDDIATATEWVLQHDEPDQ